MSEQKAPEEDTPRLSQYGPASNTGRPTGYRLGMLGSIPQIRVPPPQAIF